MCIYFSLMSLRNSVRMMQVTAYKALVECAHSFRLYSRDLDPMLENLECSSKISFIIYMVTDLGHIWISTLG